MLSQETHLSAARLTGRVSGEGIVHVRSCEQCRYLLALVRRSSGEPTDEQSEVLLDVLYDSERDDDAAIVG